MSIISGLSNHVSQEGELLRELNDAVLCVQASALGDMGLLGITKERMESASVFLVEFLERLKSALDKPTGDPTISTLVDNIHHESHKTVSEWKGDMKKLIECIKRDQIAGNEEVLAVIEDILSLLNANYSAAVRALYYRHR